MNLGKTLQDLRKNKNISQEEMADTLNVSRQTISNWENSKSYPDILSLMTLCDIYKISLDDLFKNNEDLLNNIKKNEKKKKNTIIICISVIIFLVLTLLYFIFFKDYFNNISNIKNEIQKVIDNNDSFVEIKKSKFYNKDEMTSNYMKIADSEYKDITYFLDNNKFLYSSVYRLMNYHMESSDLIGYEDFSLSLKINSSYINSNSSPFIWFHGGLDIVVYDDYFKGNIMGSVPINDNEIMISNVLANYIINYGIKTTSGNLHPKDYSDIINFKGYYYFGDYKIKICGIVDYDLSNFNDLKNISWIDLNNDSLKYQNIFNSFNLEIDVIYNKVYVNKNFVSSFNKMNVETSDNIWQKHLVRTGILVMEDDKDKMFKLFKKFDTNPYFIKSSYSVLFDKE